MDRNKTYLVLNYCSSPVAVSTRTDSFLIDGGKTEEPASMPLSLDEIYQINSHSPIFKVGLLRFEKEYEEELYRELRIRNWQDILTDKEIENIILHPTVDSLQKIIDIQLDMYFERIYGIYIGLVNANYPVRENVKTVMSARRKEFRNNQKTSRIILSKESKKDNEEMDKLKQEIKTLKALINQNNSIGNSTNDEETVNKQETVSVENSDKEVEVEKPKKRGRPKKTVSDE